MVPLTPLSVSLARLSSRLLPTADSSEKITVSPDTGKVGELSLRSRMITERVE